MEEKLVSRLDRYAFLVHAVFAIGFIVGGRVIGLICLFLWLAIDILLGIRDLKRCGFGLPTVVYALISALVIYLIIRAFMSLA